MEKQLLNWVPLLVVGRRENCSPPFRTGCSLAGEGLTTFQASRNRSKRFSSGTWRPLERSYRSGMHGTRAPKVGWTLFGHRSPVAIEGLELMCHLRVSDRAGRIRTVLWIPPIVEISFTFIPRKRIRGVVRLEERTKSSGKLSSRLYVFVFVSQCIKSCFQRQTHVSPGISWFLIARILWLQIVL